VTIPIGLASHTCDYGPIGLASLATSVCVTTPTEPVPLRVKGLVEGLGLSDAALGEAQQRKGKESKRQSCWRSKRQ
jgi:hypothetical protein